MPKKNIKIYTKNCDKLFLSECYFTGQMCLYLLRCLNIENYFSQLIFIPHEIQNKIFPSIEKSCTLYSETNDRIGTNELFSLDI